MEASVGKQGNGDGKNSGDITRKRGKRKSDYLAATGFGTGGAANCNPNFTHMFSRIRIIHS
jgi:hypothetical protein